MSAIRDNSNISRVLKGAAIRTASGLVQAKALYARDTGNVSRSVLATLAAKASPAGVTGYGYNRSPITITTNSTTVTATGASSPTYSWSTSSGWTVVNPTSATTSFRHAAVAAGAEFDATFTCTVTDGANVVSVQVAATVANNYNNLS